MSAINVVRLLLVATAIYIAFKSATAPKRGTFLTLFGNVRRDSQPRAFLVCLVAGYALSAVLILAAAFPQAWLALLISE